jgi:quercetin dioxygenase-like cupin family protein
MPVYTSADATTFEAHGSRFHSYLDADRADTLRAWRLEVQPGQTGVPHRPSREEILFVLRGSLEVSLDGVSQTASAGAVVHVPAGCEFKVDGGPDGASAWVTTTSGLTATLPSGEQIAPPWAK